MARLLSGVGVLVTVGLLVTAGFLLLSHRTVPLDAYVEKSCEFPSTYHPAPGEFDDAMCTRRATRRIPATTFVCDPAARLVSSDFDAEGSDQGKCRPNAIRRAELAGLATVTAVALVAGSVLALAWSAAHTEELSEAPTA